MLPLYYSLPRFARAICKTGAGRARAGRHCPLRSAPKEGSAPAGGIRPPPVRRAGSAERRRKARRKGTRAAPVCRHPHRAAVAVALAAEQAAPPKTARRRAVGRRAPVGRHSRCSAPGGGRDIGNTWCTSVRAGAGHHPAPRCAAWRPPRSGDPPTGTA